MSQKKEKTVTGRRFPLSAESLYVRMKAKRKGVNPEPLYSTYGLSSSYSQALEPGVHERKLVEHLNAFALAAL